RFPKERVTLVRNFPPLGTGCLPTTPRRQPREAFRLVHLGGTLTEERGITRLIEALALLDDSFTLVLGGRFVNPSYEQKVRSLPGFCRVRFVGTVPHQAVYQWYASAHAGIVPSLPLKRHHTALPVKMFEFMAAGLPVILPDFPLLRQIVAEWNCGICVNTLDPGAIAGAIRFLAENPETAQQLGANGRIAVRQRFNWSGEAENLLALYRRITQIAPCSARPAQPKAQSSELPAHVL
ncbi:MAG: glycosyltransferase, partial [candidate division WOR-3 bacterium]